MPVASADVSSHIPAKALAPPDAIAIQSLGSVKVARTVPELAVAQFAGCAPVLIVRIGDVLIVDSIASSLALRTATDN